MIESAKTETSETVASHYDDLDPFYREIWGLHVHHGFWKTGDETINEATDALVDNALKGANLSPGSKVCDIGCGYGETSRYLAGKFGVNVTGLSVSENQLAFAATLAQHRDVNLLHRDWMDNGLPSGSFDLAFSIESSEHMPDLQKFFAEAYRVLKPGGRIRVCAWLAKKNPKRWELKHLLKPICSEGRLRLCEESEYRALMEGVGFRNYHFEEITEAVKKTWTICIKRCVWKFLTDPKYLKFYVQGDSRNKKFILSLLRIRTAYETGSMKYGVFYAEK